MPPTFSVRRGVILALTLWRVCDTESVSLLVVIVGFLQESVTKGNCRKHGRRMERTTVVRCAATKEGTERPCASPLNDVKDDGTFRVLMEMQGTLVYDVDQI